MQSFSEFSLLHSLQRTLKDKGLETPTDIQGRVLPALLGGKSIVGVAQTGTGKTLAFALPILNLLKTLENDGDKVTEESRPRAAVIVPARELGEQVTRVFKLFTHETRLRVRSVVGGTGFDVAKKNVVGQFEVLVATPGRLIQLMDRGQVNLSDVRFLVFDEADQMLDKGFVAAAKRIAEACRPERQMGLFSATISPKVQELITDLFANADVIRAKDSNRFVEKLITKKRYVKRGVRFPHLKDELEGRIVPGGTLIFVNTREQCDEVAEQLRADGKNCVVYRGEMDKRERRMNLKAFREGKVDILVSTDLASRGLDVDRVTRVINYHLPHSIENYVHRVGRTARAGRQGLVVNIVTERDMPLMQSTGHA